MELQDIKIKNDGIVTRVFVGGKEIHGIAKCTFKQEAGAVPKVSLEIYSKAVTLDMPCVVYLENAFEKYKEARHHI